MLYSYFLNLLKYPNPVYAPNIGPESFPVRDVPDDDVIRVGDTYYMVSTTMFFSPVAPIMKSKDLANWEICNYVFDCHNVLCAYAEVH